MVCQADAVARNSGIQADRMEYINGHPVIFTRAPNQLSGQRRSPNPATNLKEGESQGRRTTSSFRMAKASIKACIVGTDGVYERISSGNHESRSNFRIRFGFGFRIIRYSFRIDYGNGIGIRIRCGIGTGGGIREVIRAKNEGDDLGGGLCIDGDDDMSISKEKN